MAELPGRSLEITRLGSLSQRQEAAEQLIRLLGLRRGAPGDQPPALVALPAGWQELTPSFGGIALSLGLINPVPWGLLAVLVRGGVSGLGFWAMGMPLALVGIAEGLELDTVAEGLALRQGGPPAAGSLSGSELNSLSPERRRVPRNRPQRPALVQPPR